MEKNNRFLKYAKGQARAHHEPMGGAYMKYAHEPMGGEYMKYAHEPMGGKYMKYAHTPMDGKYMKYAHEPRISSLQKGGGCPRDFPMKGRTKTFVSAVCALHEPGASCFSLFQYIQKYGPITLTAEEFPECDRCVIYENGTPIVSTMYLQ